MIERRKFLLQSTAAGLFAVTGADAASPRAALATLGDDIAAKVRRLASGREISLRLLLPTGCAANVRPVVEAFGKATGITVLLDEVPVDEINPRMLLDTLSGSRSFDLALPATFGIPDLVEAGVLVNLDGYAARHQPSGYQDNALFTIGDYYKGELYGYQTDGDAYLMFYNRDWLDAADEAKRFADRHGESLRIPRSWQELDRMMAFFHRPDEDRFGGALFRTPNYIVWEFWVRFHAKGIWPFDAEMEPRIDGEGAMEAASELIEASRHLYPQAGENGLFDNWKAFAKGNIFCNIGWGGTQKFLNGPQSQVRGRLAFSPTPGGEFGDEIVPVPYFNWGWNYTVSKLSTEPEIAYLFALFACGPEMSTRAVAEAGGFFDPFRDEHYTAPRVVDSYSQDFLTAHRESMAHSIPDLYLKGQGEYFDALREGLMMAKRGEATVAEALRRTARQWRQTTRRMGRRGQIEQWNYLRSRYPERLRRHLR